jgi:hypothetical protein
MDEWCRTWAEIPFTGGANGIKIEPPDGDGWELVQTVHIPAGRLADGQLGSLVHVWRRGTV